METFVAGKCKPVLLWNLISKVHDNVFVLNLGAVGEELMPIISPKYFVCVIAFSSVTWSSNPK